MSNPIVWVHGDCLSPTNPALKTYPDAPALFVFDDALLASYPISLKRLVFMYECLLDMPVTIRRGDVTTELSRFAREHGATKIATTDSVSAGFGRIADRLETDFHLEIFRIRPFFDYDGHLDLKRFSRYWRVAQKQVLR